MIKLSLTRLVVPVAGLALSLTAGVDVASAEPDLDAVINTTCSYHQAVSALNAENPEVAAAFNSSPVAQSILRQFLGSPPNQRVQMAQMMQSSPVIQQSFGVIQQVTASCSNY